MRAPGQIAEEIAATADRLRALQAEMIDARLAQKARVLDLFAAGASLGEIARATGLTKSAAQGILFRAGLTFSGRDALRAGLDTNLRTALRHRTPAAEMTAGSAR